VAPLAFDELMRLDGRNALVIGGSGDIGRTIAHTLGSLGANGSYDAMYAVVLTVAFLGFAADRLYLLITKRTLAWRD